MIIKDTSGGKDTDTDTLKDLPLSNDGETLKRDADSSSIIHRKSLPQQVLATAKSRIKNFFNRNNTFSGASLNSRSSSTSDKELTEKLSNSGVS
jgi:hypothetical protein